MNRRTFIAGLLASSAAVPLRSPFAADMPDAAMHPGLDLPDATALRVMESTPAISPAASIGYLRLFREVTLRTYHQELGTVWLDEASDFVVYDDGAVEG